MDRCSSKQNSYNCKLQKNCIKRTNQLMLVIYIVEKEGVSDSTLALFILLASFTVYAFKKPN